MKPHFYAKEGKKYPSGVLDPLHRMDMTNGICATSYNPRHVGPTYTMEPIPKTSPFYNFRSINPNIILLHAFKAEIELKMSD